MKLYHYVHCPFCVRVRMAAGFLGINYESVVLPYDDEETPVRLMGVKMLPIAEVDGKISNESLDIIQMLDKENVFNMESYKLNEYPKLEETLNALGKNIHSLAMPQWIWTKEFNEQSREYFQSKKEIKRGPFKELVKNKENFIAPLNQSLAELEASLSPYYHSSEFTIADILLASHLWGMYIVPEFQFSPTIHKYLQQVRKITHFDYHEDYWR